RPAAIGRQRAHRRGAGEVADVARDERRDARREKGEQSGHERRQRRPHSDRLQHRSTLLIRTRVREEPRARPCARSTRYLSSASTARFKVPSSSWPTTLLTSTPLRSIKAVSGGPVTA